MDPAQLDPIAGRGVIFEDFMPVLYSWKYDETIVKVSDSAAPEEVL